MTKRRDDWIDVDEYPDERDVDDFGDDSPVDYDRRTLGRVGDMRQPFWTRTRVFIVIVLAVLIFSALYAGIAPLLYR